jgi:hypothetical protein
MSVENGTGAFDRLVAMLDYPMFVVCTRAHGTGTHRQGAWSVSPARPASIPHVSSSDYPG